MANRYWVGGGASTNWNATGNTNWSATSGGANNASVPGSTDFAYFDGNSGTGTANISVNTAVGSVDATGYTGTWTQANSTTLTVGNAIFDIYFILSSGMTYAPSSASQAVAVTAGNFGSITTAGHTLGNLTLTAGSAGVTNTLQDALTLRGDATLTFTSGDFNANGFSVTVGSFSSSNSNTRTLTTGTATWTLTGQNGTIWNTGTITNMTFASTGMTLNFSGTGSGGSNKYTKTFSTGALTFGDINFNPNGNSQFALNLSMGWTAGNVTFTGPIQIRPTGTGNTTVSALTITGPYSLVFEGNSTNVQFLQSSGTGSLDSGALGNMNFSGGATWVATNTFNLTGNSGITITAPSAGAVAANPLGGFVGK